jgi:hypothetical protein
MVNPDLGGMTLSDEDRRHIARWAGGLRRAGVAAV